MCFIINCPIICHSQHLWAQKSNMATIGIGRLYHINNMSIFHIFGVKDFNFANKNALDAMWKEIAIH